MARLLLPLLAFGGSVAGTKPAVTLEVWYSTDCPNCQKLIHDGLLPLVEAGLPGDQVEVLAQPWPRGPTPNDGVYQPTPEDLTSIEHECAFRYALPMPAPIDSMSLMSAVKYLTCDMDDLSTPGVKRDEKSQSKCAADAGLQWDGPGGIKVCAGAGNQSEGFAVMHSRKYTKPMVAAANRTPIDAVPPFVFLNEELLECEGPTQFVATWKEQGRVPLDAPGSLLDVVCSLLAAPKPAACGEGGGPEASNPEDGKYESQCDNCAEVGKFHWSAQPSQVVWPAVIVPVCAAAVLLLMRVSGSSDFRMRSHGGSLLNEAGRDSEPVIEVSQCE